MVETKDFYNYLLSKELDFFAGVPDSFLKELCSCIRGNSNGKSNIITANEGNAIAVVSGYHLSSGKYGVVYMQNSGIGNAVNPLLSLADEEVYSIPMLLIVGWRGEPNIKDEPQHKKQGKVTLSLFEVMGIETVILDENYEEQVDYCYDYMEKNNKPIAIIVKKDTFTEYKLEQEISEYTLTRERTLECIIDNLNDNDYVVSTTGKTTREIFEIREKNKQEHNKDFLTIGAMGHASSIAYGISINTDKNVYCIDGDGSFLMHLGSLPIVAQNANSNFKYVLINNGAHDSVGGQPTVAFDIMINEVLKAVGFKNVFEATTEEEVNNSMDSLKYSNELSALIIYTKQGSRKDLGRPTISTIDNKLSFMKKIRE